MGVSPLDLELHRLIHCTLLSDANTLSDVDMHDMHVQMQVPGAVPTALWSAGTFRIYKPTASSVTRVRRTPSNLPITTEAHCSATTEMNGCIAPLCPACLHLLRHFQRQEQQQ